MRKDNRKFCASIYVRNGEQRVKLELSPASQHGGPEGFYRVRVERRWLNTEDGRPRWFDRDGLARLTAELAVCGLDIPAPVPAVPYPSRVSVRRVEDGFSCYYGAWTCTPPILAYEGIWKVGVSLDGTTQFVPVDDVIVHGGRRG